MSLFMCSKCKCIENTATSNYWTQRHPFGGGESKPALCSLCDPEIGKWHDIFPRTPAKGYMLGEDGFLYSKEDNVTHTKIVGEVKE